MESKLRKDIIMLESDTKLLQKVVFIRKTVLSSGAYSMSNMEKQNCNFERLNVPDWEREIINDSWDATSKYAHILLRKLEKINKQIKEYVKEYNTQKERMELTGGDGNNKN